MADTFSGKAGRMAAIWQSQEGQKMLQQLLSIYGPGFQQILDQLEGGFDQAGKVLDRGIKKQTTTYKDYGDQARRTLTDAGAAAQGKYADAARILDEKYGAGVDQYRTAAAGWDPLIDRNMRGFDTLLDAIGVNGPEGHARATGNFRAGPGYQWQVDQATDAAARSANARGGGYGGNTTDAITRLSSNLADQEFDDYISRLQPFQAGAAQAVGGKSDVLQALAGFYGQWGQGASGIQQHAGDALYRTGQDVAGSWTHQGDQIGGAQGNYYTAKATLPVAAATAAANVNTQRIGAEADAWSGYYGNHMDAGAKGFQSGQDAAKNRFGAWMGALDLAGKAIGGAWNTPMGGGGAGGGGGGSTAGSQFLKWIFK